jgi:hypothetical protein
MFVCCAFVSWLELVCYRLPVLGNGGSLSISPISRAPPKDIIRCIVVLETEFVVVITGYGMAGFDPIRISRPSYLRPTADSYGPNTSVDPSLSRVRLL